MLRTQGLRAQWPGRASALVIAASAAFYAVFVASSRFTIGGRSYYVLIDDAMISMTYARNLADGQGLVWQAGPHVEGYTNFLWTIWMGFLHLLPFPERTVGLSVMVSGAAILVATLLVVRSLCRRLVPDRPWVPPAAMLLVGLCFSLDFWTLRGMETGLCALLLALAVHLVLGLRAEVSDRRVVMLGVVLAAAVLTRDDMIVAALVVLAFAAYFQRHRWRRSLGIAGGILLAAFAAHAAFRLAYYGDALPNTYYLKLAGIPLNTRLHRGLVGLAWTTLTGLYLTFALAALALVCARRTSREPALALLAGVVASECVYSVYVGGDFAEQLQFPNRFLAPVLPLAMVLAAVGLSDLARREGRRGARLGAVGFGIVLLILAAVAQGRGWDATSVLYIAGAPPFGTARALIALLAAAVLAYMATGLSAPRRRAQAVLAVGLLLLTLATVNYGPVRGWATAGPADKPFERLETGRAVIFRRFSGPANSTALVAAGNWRYFSHRPGIDLLGKVDRVIAHGPNRPIVFKPGHTKWNYDYSIGRLRPDAVTDLSFATPRDLCKMRAWGYREIAPHFFVRTAAQGIDVPRLSARLSAFDNERPPIAMPASCPPRG
jgi:hypothetical protein